MSFHEDIPSKQIHTKLLEGLESICIKMNLQKRKWLVIGIYKPSQSCGKMFIKDCPINLMIFIQAIIIGDFNMTL